MQQNRQNAAANQIMNTQTPPRAGAVGPVVDPATGQVTGNITPTVGTQPQTGGMGELQMRQQMQQQDLADQLQRAKIASELALAQQRTGQGQGRGQGQGQGNVARWQQYLGSDQGSGTTGKTGKQQPYQAGDIDANTDPKADKFPIVQADFDARYGKGMYAKIAPNLANATVDDKGNYTINAPADPNNPDSKPKPIMTLPADQAQYWLSRYNAASVRSGQQPLFTDKFPSANPNSGQPAGSQVNPFKPANQLEARSLPYNKFFIDPNTGQVGQKLPEDKQQPPAGQKTSQVDTGDQGQQVADTTQPDQGQQVADTGDQGPQGPPPALAALVPGSTPGSFDLGQLPVAGGLPQDTVLADAIKRAQTQEALAA
jgi:hypothetical protein